MVTLTIPTLALLPLFLQATTACHIINQVTHTFYGWPDNDPPGAGIAFDCGRGYTAGGTGTHSDPLTFASAPGEFARCEIIYDPYTQKYLRFEDTCAQCTTDWDGGAGFWHIDVWTGSNKQGGGDDQIDCEDELTPADRSQKIVRSPREGLPVNTGKLYNVNNGKCGTGTLKTSYHIHDYC